MKRLKNFLLFVIFLVGACLLSETAAARLDQVQASIEHFRSLAIS